MNPLEKAYRAYRQGVSNPHSDFYRNLYGPLVLQTEFPSSPGEWERVPFLTKRDILRVPYHKRIFVPKEEVVDIRLTSGTSSIGMLCLPRAALRERDFETALGRGKSSMTFLYLTHHSSYIRRNAGAFRPLVAADRMNLPASAHLAAQMNVDSIFGAASILISFAPYLQQYKHAEKILVLELGLERYTSLQLQTLGKFYPNADIRFNYVQAESAGVIGLSPEVPVPGHPYAIELRKDLYYIEIVDNNGVVLPENADGEIVTTTLSENRAFPLIRYRTGDAARMFSHEGKSFFEILGRAADDHIAISGGRLIHAELEKAVTLVAGDAVVDFEAEVVEVIHNNIPLPKLSITLFTLGITEKLSAQYLAENIAKELRVSQKNFYADGVRLGMYAPLSCTVSALQSTFDQKRRHLVDRRT